MHSIKMGFSYGKQQGFFRRELESFSSFEKFFVFLDFACDLDLILRIVPHSLISSKYLWMLRNIHQKNHIDPS